MIPDDVINQIRDAVDIVAVIGQHVQLKKAGTSWKGLCPFHGEKTPSFNVTPLKKRFHCFGCQKGGDAIAFLMELEGRSFIEVAEQLAARYNIEVPKIEESPELRRARGERVAMLDLNKIATQFFRDTLAHPERGVAGRAYLAKRGVAQAVTDKFQLGYAPAEWGALADHLVAKKADLQLAVRLGLVAPRQGARGGFYDRFRDRLVCPVIVPGGEVVGFSARLVGAPTPAPDGSEPPKYVNSPESVVYKKSKLLFGLAQAREGMVQHKRVVLVEGNFDVITLHQAGFGEVVAPLGTALTIEQVMTLKRLSERIVLLYDGDRAGYKATMHALQMCVEADLEVLVASRPGNAKSGGAGPLADGIDPDSLVAGGGAEQLRGAAGGSRGRAERGLPCGRPTRVEHATQPARSAARSALAIRARVAWCVRAYRPDRASSSGGRALARGAGGRRAPRGPPRPDRKSRRRQGFLALDGRSASRHVFRGSRRPGPRGPRRYVAQEIGPARDVRKVRRRKRSSGFARRDDEEFRSPQGERRSRLAPQRPPLLRAAPRPRADPAPRATRDRSEQRRPRDGRPPYRTDLVQPKAGRLVYGEAAEARGGERLERGDEDQGSQGRESREEGR
ncbi:MAG: DNA primase [Proteobacteria bacterium]|nr:DNA primase [Pseudomonadota bacterium]